jgi:acetyl-CoA carboxylase biotin carboxyl carrier protein
VQFDLKDLRAFLLCSRNNNVQYISIRKNDFELMINREELKVNQKLSTHFITSNTNKSYEYNNKTRSDIILKQISKKKYESNSNKEPDIYFTIVSPMVGTFYRSSAPNEPKFIELYDEVEANQTVCIIEAMKLMNEIEAEIKGNIIEILVNDGDIVDCGQALMKIKPSKI